MEPNLFDETNRAFLFLAAAPGFGDSGFMVLPTTRAHPNQYHGSTTRAHPNKYDKNDESKKHNFYIHVSCVEVCT